MNDGRVDFASPNAPPMTFGRRGSGQGESNGGQKKKTFVLFRPGAAGRALPTRTAVAATKDSTVRYMQLHAKSWIHPAVPMFSKVSFMFLPTRFTPSC